jgi:hypothetical protein
MKNRKKIKKSDILKKGAKLVAEKIDFRNPSIRAIIASAQSFQQECRKRMKFDHKQLEKRITI